MDGNSDVWGMQCCFLILVSQFSLVGFQLLEISQPIKNQDKADHSSGISELLSTNNQFTYDYVKLYIFVLGFQFGKVFFLTFFKLKVVTFQNSFLEQHTIQVLNELFEIHFLKLKK